MRKLRPPVPHDLATSGVRSRRRRDRRPAAFLGLGSNLGDRRAYLRDAVATLADVGPTRVSPGVRDRPGGRAGRPGPYLNLVVELDTDRSPRDLLGVCHRLEAAAERVREVRWGPARWTSTCCGSRAPTVDEPDLEVPHPRMWERRFVLAPLHDLAPDLVDEAALDAAEGLVEPVGPLDTRRPVTRGRGRPAAGWSASSGPGGPGASLALALAGAGWEVLPMLGGATTWRARPRGSTWLVLATPDGAIAGVAQEVRPGPARWWRTCRARPGWTCWRRTGAGPPSTRWWPCPTPRSGPSACGGGGSRWPATRWADEVVDALGGRAFAADDADRAAYHAAAVIASNHLVALLGQVERLAAAVGRPVRGLPRPRRPPPSTTCATGPRRPDRAGGPGRRGHDPRATWPPSPPGSAGATPGAGRRRPPPGRPPRSPAVKTVATIAELRRPRPTAAGRAAGARSASCPPWATSTTGTPRSCGQARAETDLVVASIFVNPLQFGPGEDLEAYPRDLAGDTAWPRRPASTCCSRPPAEEMYPEPVLTTTVSVAGVSEPLEGGPAPTHFAGVATVVAKLFSIVGPCRAYFGEKDFQQLAVVRRWPATCPSRWRWWPAPRVREPDGLAMSSRNVYLSPDERAARPCCTGPCGRGRRPSAPASGTRRRCAA